MSSVRKKREGWEDGDRQGQGRKEIWMNERHFDIIYNLSTTYRAAKAALTSTFSNREKIAPRLPSAAL